MAQTERVRGLVLVCLLGLGVGAASTCASPHLPPGYVTRAAVWQARLLWGRVPIETAEPLLSPPRAEQLRLVPRVKDFAEDQLGLVGAGTYDLVHPTWDATIWNVSGCRPLAFENRTWWFPFVGTVPYLGYFDRAPADQQAARLEADGYEVWVRPAGTYSTLGWFDDPVLPGMLDWSEQRLADTLIHELVHANVWVRGSVAFNESLASFVGQRGAIAWMSTAYGPDAPEVVETVRSYEDGERFRRLLVEVVAELDQVYRDASLSDGEKLEQKASILEGLPARAGAAGLHDARRYEARLADGTWNNARLLQYRTYNRGHEAFEALYEAEGRDLRRFLDRIRALAASGGDPWAALAEATGTVSES
jgi:predicted aminopeptidase